MFFTMLNNINNKETKSPFVLTCPQAKTEEIDHLANIIHDLQILPKM